MHTGPVGIGLSALGGAGLVGTAAGMVGYAVGGNLGEERIIRRLKESDEFIRWKAQICSYVAIPALRQFTRIEADLRDQRSFDQRLQASRDAYNIRVDQQRQVFDAHRIGVSSVERERVIHDAHMTGQEVALHERATKKWDYKRRAEHAPPYKESVLCCSRSDLLALAQEIGPFTHQVAEFILSHPSVDKLRPVRCLLGLSGKYPKERVERACERASICKIYSCKSVKSILENDLDRESVEMATAKKIVPFHRYRFERDPSDYKSDETFEERLEKLHPTSKHGNAMAGVFNALIADRVIDDCKNRIAAEKG
jgi:hypothetical protein